MRNKTVRIANTMVSSFVNGPGRRFVIWLQGCTFRCKGCFNPEFHSMKGGKLMSIEEIMNHIEEAGDIEGVTYSGGEPMLQAVELIELSKRIKKKSLSIVCYTGFTYEQILGGKVKGGRELLQWIDILIDGLFIEEEKAPLLWRGSRNQRVYFLTDRYKHLEPFVNVEGKRGVEIVVGRDGLKMTGFFDMVLWEKLKRKLKGD